MKGLLEFVYIKEVVVNNSITINDVSLMCVSDFNNLGLTVMNRLINTYFSLFQDEHLQ